MKDRYWFMTKRSYLWAALALGGVVGAGALVGAAVPHAFNTGDTLAAADLNGNFAALDQRIAALEAREPFAGTYPAVRGLSAPAAGAPGGGWFCGSAPTTINVSSAIATTGFTLSDAYGDIIFTNGGAFGVDLSLGTAASSCPTNVCASPITYYLKSPTDQTITVHAFVDDVGAVYVNGAQRAVTTGATLTLSYNAVANIPFSLSFMACSNNGPTLGLTVNDPFITTYNLSVDYDATFHRLGK
jgi:hypothetical protein